MSTFIQIAKRFMAKQLKIQDKGKEEAELAKLLEETYNRGHRESPGDLKALAADLNRRGLSRSGLMLDNSTEAVLEIRALKAPKVK